MAFTNKDVMDLRAKTGVGMMDCKKALAETDGDMDKAIDLLREKGMATGAKRAGKIASQGIVSSLVSGDTTVLLEVNCESDFVARGEQYKALVDSIATYIANNDVVDIEEVKVAMNDVMNEAVARIGEKIDIRRFVKYSTKNSVVDSYIHMGGKIGVIVEMSPNASIDLAHDVALQIAAANPSYINISEVPSEELENEKEILKAQALNEPNPKPIAIIEKMVEGRINKYYKEVCLMEQDFVKDSDKQIKTLLKESGNIQIIKFTRFAMGEGLEKKDEDLGKEVEEQIAKMKK